MCAPGLAARFQLLQRSNDQLAGQPFQLCARRTHGLGHRAALHPWPRASRHGQLAGCALHTRLMPDVYVNAWHSLMGINYQQMLWCWAMWLAQFPSKSPVPAASLPALISSTVVTLSSSPTPRAQS